MPRWKPISSGQNKQKLSFLSFHKYNNNNNNNNNKYNNKKAFRQAIEALQVQTALLVIGQLLDKEHTAFFYNCSLELDPNQGNLDI